MTVQILQLLTRIHTLKQTARTGWNMGFPPGHRFKTRHVPGAESVADHSYSLAMYAFAVAVELGLDAEKMVTMALVHDVTELITTDIVTAILEGDDKVIAKADKRWREEAAAKDLFLQQGAFGARCHALWCEYADQTSEEAMIVYQLDKLECAAQAVRYEAMGHKVNAQEFIDNARPSITHPLLVRMLDELRG